MLLHAYFHALILSDRLSARFQKGEEDWKDFSTYSGHCIFNNLCETMSTHKEQQQQQKKTGYFFLSDDTKNITYFLK